VTVFVLLVCLTESVKAVDRWYLRIHRHDNRGTEPERVLDFDKIQSDAPAVVVEAEIVRLDPCLRKAQEKPCVKLLFDTAEMVLCSFLARLACHMMLVKRLGIARCHYCLDITLVMLLLISTSYRMARAPAKAQDPRDHSKE